MMRLVVLPLRQRGTGAVGKQFILGTCTLPLLPALDMNLFSSYSILGTGTPSGPTTFGLQA